MEERRRRCRLSIVAASCVITTFLSHIVGYPRDSRAKRGRPAISSLQDRKTPGPACTGSNSIDNCSPEPGAAAACRAARSGERGSGSSTSSWFVRSCGGATRDTHQSTHQSVTTHETRRLALAPLRPGVAARRRGRPRSPSRCLAHLLAIEKRAVSTRRPRRESLARARAFSMVHHVVSSRPAWSIKNLIPAPHDV